MSLASTGLHHRPRPSSSPSSWIGWEYYLSYDLRFGSSEPVVLLTPLALTHINGFSQTWIVIHRHDLADLMYHIRSDIAMAKLAEAFMRKDERFEIVVQRKFALVCFMLKPKAEDGGELNFKLVEAINSSGRAL
ncbi:hypothetical protein V6N13_032870 [Hibiscus sabdariffa]|uniref:Uncharacterized protein n=1 Tax=Hibiscus sabdariffa TaxID=183260 RepID=A0ABR2FC56_9ROSI